MQRKTLGALAFVALLCAVVFYCGYVKMNQGQRERVAPNRGPEVLDGFRGEAHPLLRRGSELEVTANWDYHDDGQVFAGTPASGAQEGAKLVRRLFQCLKVAIPTKTYSERDFSRLLPAEPFSAVGQLWAIDVDSVAVFLKQFHAVPSMHLVSTGKREGPDGAFAVLRAVSPSHLDIVFRIHAEFDLLEKPCTPVSRFWYTPACFLGRLLLNRSTGTVDYFRLSLPTDTAMNVHLTVTYLGQPESHHMIHVERMELKGGNPHSVVGIHWEDQIETVEAYDRLARVFYKFKEIHWVGFDQAVATARAQKKPIFAVVALGALDDQGC